MLALGQYEESLVALWQVWHTSDAIRQSGPWNRVRE